MKNQNGITLIALIITIIVLLILAGVSISLVVGQNGILEKSQEAVTETKKASVEEQIQLAWTACEMEYLTAGSGKNKSDYFTAAELGKNLPENIKIVEDGLYVNDTGDSVLVLEVAENGEVKYQKISVSLPGKVSVLGETTSTPQMITLADKINANNYGDYVNYQIDLGITTAENNELSDNTVPKTDWRIFYEDGTNVYLIASDYLPISKFPSGVFGADNGQYNGYWVQNSEDTTKLTTSGIVNENLKNNFLFTKLSNVATQNYNYQAISTLLDTNKWSGFAKEGYVDNVDEAVIGSPTIEMWIASWNERYKDELAFDANEKGYQVGLAIDSLSNYIDSPDIQLKEGWNNTLYYPHANDTATIWNNCKGYWLASPSIVHAGRVMGVYYDGGISSSGYSGDICGVRPIVALKKGIVATKDANDIWQLDI